MSETFSADNTPAMREAVRRAQETFPFYMREVWWEQRRVIKGLNVNAIKVAFDVPERGPDVPETEHMWVSDVSFDGRTVTGTLMNTADFIPGLAQGTEISVPVEQVNDWMYASMGVVCGGFTVQAMRAEMSPEERQAHDEAWGLPFPDPALCNITPYAVEVKEPPKGLSRFWKKDPGPAGLPYDEALAHARANEHPMSVNAREMVEQEYQKNSALLNQVFDDGWTMLHMDSVAGNLAQVETALSMGANPTVQTPDGRTPRDLAEAMGWTRVVEALKRANG